MRFICVATRCHVVNGGGGLGLGLGFDKSRFSAFKHISYYLFLLVVLCILYALLPVAMQ